MIDSFLYRSSSPWTERPESLTPSWSQPWSLPWEKRCFPLSDEQVKDLEVTVDQVFVTLFRVQRNNCVKLSVQLIKILNIYNLFLFSDIFI